MAAPPQPSLRACAACGNPVDPVRAPVVAILDGRFAYFCSAECKRSTSALSIAPPEVRPRTPEPPPSAPEPRPPTPEPPPSIVDDVEEPRPYEDPESPARELPPVVSSELSRIEAPVAPEPEEVAAVPRVAVAREASAPIVDRDGRSLRLGALVFAALAVVLALVDARAHLLRLGLATIATALLVGTIPFARARSSARGDDSAAAIERDLGGPLLAAALAAVASVGLAWALHAMNKPGYATAVGATVWVVLAAAGAEVVAHTSMRATLADARALLSALDPDGGAMPGVGDVVELAPGDRARADLILLSGSIVIDQWGSSTLRSRRREGEPVPAGAVVREGSARARVTAVGRGRAFARLLGEAIERSDRASPGLRALDRAAPWIALAVAVVAIALGLVSRGKIGPTLVAGVAAGASLLVPPARRLAVRDQLRGIVEACRRGAAFRDPDAFVRAGSVRTAIFCARGTFLASFPDACDVEEVPGQASATDVLALAAGAERGIDHPIARKLLEDAQTRGVRPVDVRNAVFEPGLGVVGELAPSASGGAPRVVVGGRALCLREHVATAEHEARITELEQRGRDVVLVARGGRVVGWIALQYALRAGALAAVQRLQDIEVEPVLLGGGARERLEAIGRAVDVQHVRPEVLPRERGAEVKRIAQSSGPVAVVGRAALDEGALAAAEVSIVLNEAGVAPRGEADRGPAIALVHDHLVTAVDVLALAQATRARVAATLTVGLAPAVLAALPVAFGLVRPAYAPLAALAATVALGVRDLVAAALPEGGRIDDTR